MPTQDQVVLTIGYTEYVVPMKAGLAIFNAMSGADIYTREDRYEKVGNDHQRVYYIKPVDADKVPRLQHIGPAQFHVGLENQRMKEEEEARKNATTT